MIFISSQCYNTTVIVHFKNAFQIVVYFTPQSLQNVKYDNVAQFLPPGFKVNSEQKEQPRTTTRKTTTTNDPTTTRSSGVPKLSLANLFGDIKNDDLSGLLPPGFNPNQWNDNVQGPNSIESFWLEKQLEISF